jgi:hypothetical protein
MVPNHAKKHGVRYTSFQGVIHGKRCGVSKSIGPAAIRRHWEHLTARQVDRPIAEQG